MYNDHYTYGYLAVPTKQLGMSYVFGTTSRGVLSITSLNEDTIIVITLTTHTLISVNGTKVKSLTISLSRFESYQMLCDSYCDGYAEGNSPFLFVYGTRVTITGDRR